MRTLLLILALTLLVVVLVLAAAKAGWRRETGRLLALLRRSSRPFPAFSAQELRDLPAPVARYLAMAIPEGQLPLPRVRLKQEGSFLVKPGPTGWRPFTAQQETSSQPLGFVWDARIALAPGLAVWVRDSFVEGQGGMTARLAGLVRMADVRGTPEIAAGALLRYLAEATWLPTALLPSSGVRWEALDETSARAHLEVGATRVWLDFHFGDGGLVEWVYTPERGREVGGRSVPTPWQGRFSAYQRRSGLLIPTEGEVEWLLPEGPQPYWRGRIVAAEYR